MKTALLFMFIMFIALLAIICIASTAFARAPRLINGSPRSDITETADNKIEPNLNDQPWFVFGLGNEPECMKNGARMARHCGPAHPDYNALPAQQR